MKPVCLSLIVVLSFPCVHGATQELERSLDGLRSDSEFERQESWLELQRMGDEILPELARRLQTAGRLHRFRLEGLLLGRLDRFLDRLDSEYRALLLDERELLALRLLEKQVSAHSDYRERLAEAAKADAAIAEKVDAALELEALEKLASEASDERPLSPTEATRLTELRARRADWIADDPQATARLEPLLELKRGLDPLTASRQFSELENMRVGELDQRVEERRPRVETMRADLEQVGWIGYNRIVARFAHAPENLLPFYEEVIERGLETLGREAFDEALTAEAFERVRYQQGLLWGWQASAPEGDDGGLRATARKLLERHVSAVLTDLGAPETIVEERAAEELFLLGRVGFEALKQKLKSSDNRAAGSGASERLSFLHHLLRWRIRPSTYADFGIEFRDFPKLAFRDRRERVFDYARVAREKAVPTLRAIVVDDDLEESFFVKLAAAKALAGLRDLTGYTFLLAKHPDMRLKKPEVSRELIVIQAYEWIRAKEFEKAIEELERVLNEDPFDFAANYHTAFAYLLLRNYAKSIHHFEVARRIRPQDHLTLYNLACAYALAGGMVDKALDALTDSADAGFTDYEHMEKDPDLESLRGEPRYQELIKRLKEQ